MDALLNILIPILMLVESNGNPRAVGDKGAAVGILQIHPICVKDVNRILKKKTYTLADRKDPVKSMEMCTIYLNYYGKKFLKKKDLTNRERIIILARIWNGGPIGYRKKATIPYMRKVEKLLDNPPKSRLKKLAFAR